MSKEIPKYEFGDDYLVYCAMYILDIKPGILGIRPEHRGLLIDPCIPDCWSGFSVKRICRGTVCDITVHRGEKVGVSVNGKPIQGQIVPWELFVHTDLKIQCVIGGKKAD